MAVGGSEAGGATVGAGVAAGAAVGCRRRRSAPAVAVWPWGSALGVAVGVARVGLALGEALADGWAEALALGEGEAARARTGERADLHAAVAILEGELVCPRDSTRPTPWKAARNCVSCVMMSSGQASRVVASGPIAATLPLVVYGP